MRNAKHPKHLLLLLSLLLLLPCALALTASPAKLLFDTPGAHEFTLTVRDYQGEVSVRAAGDLADSVSINTRQGSPGEVRFTGTITIPENLTPGDHTQELLISSAPPAGGGFSGNVEVTVLLVARKRYDGPYLVPSLDAQPDQSLLDTTRVSLTLENRGNQGITPARITLTAAGSATDVPPAVVPPGGFTPFSALVHGRGEQTLRLHVEGVFPLDQEYPVTLGHPIITDLQAGLVPDNGQITPVKVSGTVSWNAPVQATLRIGEGSYEKSYTLTVNSSFSDTYYIDRNFTDNASVPVTLQVSGEQRTVQAVFPSAAVKPLGRSALPYIIALVLLLLLASIYLVVRLARARQPPL